ncbi:MAG: TVP38/TMEM64 family protein [Ruminococcus sp.]|nr:TVP38/TMEM64 family protein [Ruminococcus sp.]
MQEDTESRSERSERYKKRVRIISLAVFAAFIIFAAVLSIPLIRDLRTEEGLERMKERLGSYSGIAGVLIFTGIQAMQVVIAVIPAIQIVGGMLFGWFFGAVLSFLGILIGTFIIFVIVGKLGRPLAEAFVDEKLMKRYKFLSDEKKLIRILMILYIIPGVPKDVISYIVPLTKVSRRDFFLFVMPCRIPAVVLSTVFGSNVVSGNFKIAVIVFSVCAALAILGFVLKDPILDRLNKRKEKNNRPE